MSVVHAFAPAGGFIVSDMRETLCGAAWGIAVEGGLVPVCSIRRVVVRAVDYGTVTCKRCAKAQRETVQ